MKSFGIAAIAALATTASAQYYQRLGACPTLGCVFPPDQAEFLAGQYFDIRLEVHTPLNGSEATGRPTDPNFTFTVAGPGNGTARNATQYFNLTEPALERWQFSWFEDLFARDANKASFVNVTAKAYRRVYLKTPGTYYATLTYNNGSQTVAQWTVRDLSKVRKAKNVILFIGDGMTTNMITAARLIGHKSINGVYQTKMQMDQFPVLGHQMTHSLDSFITDSANSATALYTGKKSTVNALNCYADSSPNKWDDPKVETIAELVHRQFGGAVGIVSTAFLADATPAALTAHTRDRNQYGSVIESYLNGVTANYTWTNWTGPDVLFGGGAENFFNATYGGSTLNNTDQYAAFAKRGYSIAMNNTQLQALPNTAPALGVFSVSNMAKWLDRNVYTANLRNQNNSADGLKKDAVDQPGLKEMTLKAIDIVQTRSNGKGWFVMSEAASIDKMMHVLDYDRALGELLELDDTIKATVAKLRTNGELNNTLILVTADHGHGFDVFGSYDSQYGNAQTNDRAKRGAVGVYQNSGLSQYANTGNLTYSQGINFPSNWDPRYTLAQGVGANPDHRENYQVHKGGPRLPAVAAVNTTNYYVNPADDTNGFLVNGTLSVDEPQGVHSLTDVPVFAMGPASCQSNFNGVFSSIDIFYGIADCFGLAGFA